MKLHEYQAKEILRKYGVNVRPGKVVEKKEDLGKAYEEIGGAIVAVKSQIHAGGRGKGTLYDGEDPTKSKEVMKGGVKIAKTKEEVIEYGSKILGNYLVTHQTGGKGKKVLKVYLEKGTNIAREFYLSILHDRAINKPIIMASSEGGMEIEEVAAKYPEKIIKIPIEPAIGMMPWQAREILFRLNVPEETIKTGTSFLLNLWKAYDSEDSSLLEINPLVLSVENELVALDCKFSYDDNALFRHPEAKELRDITEEDPLELKASEYNLNYVRLDGEVGCMVNGAGLAMATMDLIKHAGSFPANFLDVGGGANPTTVANGFRIILEDPNVKAIFVNIFGGIVQCDRVANGIVQAAKDIKIHVPLIVRLKGTNADIAAKILADSGLPIIVANEMEDAAEKIKEVLKK
ncbi:MAG: ADP-forming succinate--CoA ligase subunit beta [Leptonema sp. (in: bacteria)]